MGTENDKPGGNTASADDTKNKPDLSDRLEVVVGGTKASSGDFASGTDTTVSETADGGLGLDFNTDGTVEKTGLKKGVKSEGAEEPEGGEEPSETEEAPEEEETGAEEEDTETSGEEDLGEYDPENEEVVAKFDAKYFTEDGTELNIRALSDEFWSNRSKDEKAGLNDATYAYLKDRLGLSKEAIQEVEAGQVAKQEKANNAFYERAGGKDAYETMLGWGKENYSEAQRAKFNEAIAKGGEELEDQLDLLRARFEKAGGRLPAGATASASARRPGAPGRRAAKPAKSAATAAATASAGGGVKPFANAEEHRKAQAEADRSGDRAKITEVRDRLKASSFWK